MCVKTCHAHEALPTKTNGTDRNDARGLAELMRVGWYRAAWVGGRCPPRRRSPLLGRRLPVRTERMLENTLRGPVKRFGLIITKTARRRFPQRAAAMLERDPAHAALAALI